MLYDLLPPSIFFLSLSGVLIIVSRVVLRMRKFEHSANIQAVAQGTGTGIAAWRGSATTRLLKPNQKSVHQTGSRFNVLRSSIAATRESLFEAKQRRAKRHQQRRDEVMAKSQRNSEIRRPVSNVREKASSVNRFIRTASSRLGSISKAAAASTVSRLSIVRFRNRNIDETPIAEINENHIDDSNDKISSRITTRIIDTVADVGEIKGESQEDWPVEATPKKRELKRSLKLRRRSGQEQDPVKEAEIAIEQKNYSQAESILVPYIVKHTTDRRAYMLLGEAALGRGDSSEAIEIYQQLLEWNPHQRGAHIGLGRAAFQAGRYTQALEALQQAYNDDPANRLALELSLNIAKKLDNPALQHSYEEKLAELSSLAESQTEQANS
jgi:tetratricopeptide (TPR) repeat protein